MKLDRTTLAIAAFAVVGSLTACSTSHSLTARPAPMPAAITAPPRPDASGAPGSTGGRGDALQDRDRGLPGRPRLETPAATRARHDRPTTSSVGADRVTFGERESDAPPHGTSVGLYGELTGMPGPTGRADGAGNLTQITATTEGASFDPSINAAGTMLVFASTQHRRTADIYVKAINGRTMTQITSDPADDVMPAFAPDSTGIAFASNRGGDWNIYYTNVNGDAPVQITFDPAPELHPTWSPDGTTLAYCKYGTQSGRWEIWCVNVNQTSGPRFLEYGLFPQWNPDPARSKITFQRARERGSRLFSVWTIDYVNGEAMHPTEIVSAANAAAMHPSWSPEGSRLVFVTVVDPTAQDEGDRPRVADVWVVDHDGRGRTNLTNGRFLNLYPAWGADGAVYFLSNRSGVDNIWAVETTRTIDIDDTYVPPLLTSDGSP